MLNGSNKRFTGNIFKIRVMRAFFNAAQCFKPPCAFDPYIGMVIAYIINAWYKECKE